MKFSNKENEKIELADGRVIWISRSVAVMAVIVAHDIENNKKYALVCKRGKDTPDYQGYYCCPCGYLDWDESAEQGAIREVWEETNIDVENIVQYNFIDTESCLVEVEIEKNYFKQPFWVNSSIFANRQNVTLCFGVLFNVKNFDSLPVPSPKNVNTDSFEEVEEVLWMDVSQIEGAENFAFNHNARIMQFLKEF